MIRLFHPLLVAFLFPLFPLSRFFLVRWRAVIAVTALGVVGLGLTPAPLLADPDRQSGQDRQSRQERRERQAAQALIAAALERTEHMVRYEPAYVALTYPMGDVPADTGVCTDVIIRSYRNGLDLDLQRLVHEDMKAHFSRYPRNWGLTRPDPNIDHRRVPNLEVFFRRKGQSLPITQSPGDYRPGDLVTWRLPGNLPHIGIVTDRVSRRSRHPLIVHNIGEGPKLEDMLFAYPITGHYRWLPRL